MTNVLCIQRITDKSLNRCRFLIWNKYWRSFLISPLLQLTTTPNGWVMIYEWMVFMPYNAFWHICMWVACEYVLSPTLFLFFFLLLLFLFCNKARVPDCQWKNTWKILSIFLVQWIRTWKARSNHNKLFPFFIIFHVKSPMALGNNKLTITTRVIIYIDSNL